MPHIEVFADIACPFAHAALRTVADQRRVLGVNGARLWVRAWPLEIVNDEPHDPDHLGKEVQALRETAAPDLFEGFDPEQFPHTTLPALAATAAAYRAGREVGEAFSLAVRNALWEEGVDISDADVLHDLAADLGVAPTTDEDEDSVRADLEEGRRRGVDGSPHFFTSCGDFFNPTLEIDNDGDGMDVTFDQQGFRQFVDAAFT